MLKLHFVSIAKPEKLFLAALMANSYRALAATSRKALDVVVNVTSPSELSEVHAHPDDPFPSRRQEF
ncbi:hypothetical protein O5541_27360 [Escherichia coli]|nr:hypothetical protein [Escherichia coli]